MKTLKLIRNAGVIHVTDSTNTILGELPLQQIEAIQKPETSHVKGFVKRVRVLWVKTQDPTQVKHFALGIFETLLGLLRTSHQKFQAGNENAGIHH